MGSAAGAAAARARRSAAAQTAYEAADDCRPLIAGIDTLNLSSRAELSPRVVEELKALREEAVAVRKARRKGQQAQELPRWTSSALPGLPFEVQPYGTRKGLCLLTNEFCALVLNPDGPRNFPRAYVELKAPFLWSGWETAADKACALLGESCVADAALDVQVSRIDLACDFAGWTPTPDLLDHVCGRVVRRDQMFEWGQHEKPPEEEPRAPWARPHTQGRRFTGFTFGGGDLLCRLYDKTVEIRRSRKTWFEPKYAAAGWRGVEDDGHVWRLEFQVRREPLTHAELTIGDESTNMKSWDEVKRGLDGLWRYLTTKWLSYRLPRTGRERVRLHPRWRRLMGATFTADPDARLIRHHRQLQLERCTGALAGYLKRELALMWKERGQLPRRERLEEDLAFLLDVARKHYDERHDSELFEAAQTQWRAHRSWEAMFSRPREPARA